jgi:hypothetical protein
MNEEPKYILLDKTESLLESWGKDLVTFGFLLLCIYVSSGSNWWTFFTGTMTLLVIAGKVQSASKRQKKFTSKEELISWAQKQD